MTNANRSILVISPDQQVSSTIGSALSAMPGLKVDVEATTLSGMNGRAARVASNYDIILFQTSPDDGHEMQAIEALNAARKPGTVLLALTDTDIPLSQARALNRVGVDEVLPLAGAADDVSDQLSRIGQAHRSDGARSGRIIAVAQSRGGVGATTVAVNLADKLARERRRLRSEVRRSVALLDLDLQFGTCGSVLDLPEQDTLHRIALEAVIPDRVFLQQSVQTTAHGLTVLAAPSRLTPLDALRPEQVSAVIESLRATHDYVIVDLPRALVGWVEPILHRADQLLVVTDLSVPSVRHCRRLIDFFTADHVTLPVEIVVNRDRRGLFGSAVRREAEKALDRKLTQWLPDDPRAARQAIDRGAPLSVVAPSSRLSRAIDRLAATMLKTLPVIAQTAAR